MKAGSIGMLTALAAASLALGGCSESADAPQPANTTAAVARKPGGYIERIMALNDQQRQGVLYRAIVDARHACQKIAGTRRNPDVNGMPAWAVRCNDGGGWLVAFDDGGTAYVTGVPGTGMAGG